MARKRYADRRTAWPLDEVRATMSGSLADKHLADKLAAEGHRPKKRRKRQRLREHELELWEDWKVDGVVVRWRWQG